MPKKELNAFNPSVSVKNQQNAFVQNVVHAIVLNCFGPAGAFPENFVQFASITPIPLMIRIPAGSVP